MLVKWAGGGGLRLLREHRAIGIRNDKAYGFILESAEVQSAAHAAIMRSSSYPQISPFMMGLLGITE